MKPRWIALMLMAGGALFAQPRVAIGVQFGRPAPVVVPASADPYMYRPPCPGPGYVWIEGYYDESGNWYEGYWALPPYAGAYWVTPRFYSGHYYSGYWGGPRGNYRVAPRMAPPAYDRSYGRGFTRSAPGRYDSGSRGRSYGSDRGSGRGSEFRNGSHR